MSAWIAGCKQRSWNVSTVQKHNTYCCMQGPRCHALLGVFTNDFVVALPQLMDLLVALAGLLQRREGCGLLVCCR